MKVLCWWLRDCTINNTFASKLSLPYSTCPLVIDILGICGVHGERTTPAPVAIPSTSEGPDCLLLVQHRGHLVTHPFYSLHNPLLLVNIDITVRVSHLNTTQFLVCFD